jgi:hypothetical protein
MKKILFLILLTPIFAFASIGNPSLDAITKAIGSGDTETLSKYFSDQVEISIQDKEQICSKTQAIQVIRDFFTANKPKTFSQVHNGTSRENSDQYCIGNLVSTNGTYRVYLYLKPINGILSIQEIRFDKE